MFEIAKKSKCVRQCHEDATVIVFVHVCFYCSPQGDRVRSRVELLSVLNGILDLSTFDYKTGQFCDIKSGPIRVRSRKVLHSCSFIYSFIHITLVTHGMQKC